MFHAIINIETKLFRDFYNIQVCVMGKKFIIYSAVKGNPLPNKPIWLMPRLSLSLFPPPMNEGQFGNTSGKT